jgi:hypothetical protein
LNTCEVGFETLASLIGNDFIKSASMLKVPGP